MPLPRFRPLLKVVPQKMEEKDVFVVADQQEGVFDHQIVLPPMAFVVAAFLDGKREIEDVMKAIEENVKGAKVTEEELRSVIEDLDKHYLLETDRLRDKRRAMEQEFIALPARAAKFVQGTRQEVAAELESFYDAEAGAGRPGESDDPGPSAIVAPHIDFNRGGTCYTFAYKEIAERCEAEVYVILGVAHSSPPNPFVVTSKGYDTAFGIADPDKEILATLEKRVGRGIYESETVHRAEHSAEFQAVFLKHARPGVKCTYVPILCSAFDTWCGTASPSTVPRIDDFLSALAESMRGRKVCLVAGVDFAHVGPVFGDERPVDKKLVDWMVEGDNRNLKAAAGGSSETFWNVVMSDANARHYCGLSATYSTLKLLGGEEGKLLKYGFAPDPQGGIVSFASMVFGEGGRNGGEVSP